jgi:quinol-cytochrome oxidoreductase complex cytochrome b subunit
MGQFMRDLHRIGAEGMVLFVCLHMLRTFITGSYKRPRQFTWFTGVILLLVTLFLSFSGYLLPWDQLAFWAVTIGTSMAEAAPPEVVGTNVNLLLRGAPDIGAGGLLRFYLLHVFALPLVLFTVLFVHYYKVVLHGISLPASTEEVGEDTAKRVPKEKRVYYIPDVLTTELMWVSLVTFILVAYVTWFYHAPLENHANPQVTPLHTTAPWYFLWLQGGLKLGDKILFGVILPTIIFGFLFVMPYIDVGRSRRYAHRRVGLTLGLLTVSLLMVLQFMGTPLYGVDTAADVQIEQDLIPDEGVGPVRAIPYEQLMLTATAPLYGDFRDVEATGIPLDEVDAALESNGAFVLREDEIYRSTPDGNVELDEAFEDDYPALWESIEEFDHLLFDEYGGDLANATGYIIITQVQPNLRRYQVYITWDDVNDAGEEIRNNSGKVAYIHAEAEWHEE